ncbi:MAG: hypothetical protein VSS75_013760 [Candidatus Parabeggiatoa sp.]|nr:hypothetical protein [Candidatus Parabeggiatoa sp.]
MIFIETSHFTAILDNYLNDDEYRELQNYLLENPNVGAIIRGSGGMRKLRWAARGKGKSGGIRGETHGRASLLLCTNTRAYLFLDGIWQRRTRKY